MITGTGRRRQFSEDFKAEIVGETLAPGTIVSEVARRHGLTPQQVFTWRRQARRTTVSTSGTEAPQFVPAVVEASLPARTAPRGRKRSRRAERTTGIIEVEIDGVTVRVGRGLSEILCVRPC
ncbi:MAG: transposase [Variibacter sp.]